MGNRYWIPVQTTKVGSRPTVHRTEKGGSETVSQFLDPVFFDLLCLKLYVAHILSTAVPFVLSLAHISIHLVPVKLEYQLTFICFTCAGAEQCGRHQGNHQEEPGQESEPPRQGDQNFKGEHLA